MNADSILVIFAAGDSVEYKHVRNISHSLIYLTFSYDKTGLFGKRTPTDVSYCIEGLRGWVLANPYEPESV